MNSPNKLTRAEAMTIVDGELNHAYAKNGPEMHSPIEWVLFMRQYLDEAAEWGTHWTPQSHNQMMALVRKVGCCAVAAIEQNGAPARELPGEDGRPSWYL